MVSSLAHVGQPSESDVSGAFGDSSSELVGLELLCAVLGFCICTAIAGCLVGMFKVNLAGSFGTAVGKCVGSSADRTADVIALIPHRYHTRRHARTISKITSSERRLELTQRATPIRTSDPLASSNDAC